MAESDNTLGAPTEGLGQTVTFAGSQGGRTPQMAGRQRSAMRTGGRGGEARLTAQALHIPDQGGDATLKAFSKLGGDLIKPMLEQERTAAYVSGMQRAAQGEAITEIVAEQPWYSKLFGSTSLVDGARAYTANAKASSVAADMEAKMPELRKLSAEEFGKYATEAITSQNTGDAATDMLLSQQISATLPAVMKGQAKAHLRFQQEQLETSMQASQGAAFALLGTTDAESRKPGATRDSSDVLGAAISALGVLEKPAEMQQDLHDKLLGESAMKAISGGNFAAYNLLKDSGKLASLDPQVAYNVERTYRQASAQAKLNVPDHLLQKVADFRVMARQPNMTDEDILAAAAGINTEYRNMTGDNDNFLGNAQTLAEMQQLRDYRDAQQAAQRRAVTAASSKVDKESAELQQLFTLASRVVTGDGPQPYYMFDETPKEQQAVFDHIRATANPETRLRVLVDQYTVATDKVERGQNESAIARAIQAGDPGMLYQVYAERYLPLVKAGGDLGEAVAEEYAGKYGDKMKRYHALANGQPVAADLQGAFYNDVVLAPKPLATSKRNTAIVEELTTGRVMSLFKQPIRDPEGFAAVLEPKMKAWLDVPAAVADARKNSPNISLVGGYHWPKSTQATDVTRWVLSNRVAGGVAANTLDEAFSNTVQRNASEAGIEGKLTIGQTVDLPDRQPQLYLMGEGSDGKIKVRVFPASQIHDDWKNTQPATMQHDVLKMDKRNLGDTALDKALKARPKKE